MQEMIVVSDSEKRERGEREDYEMIDIFGNSRVDYATELTECQFSDAKQKFARYLENLTGAKVYDEKKDAFRLTKAAMKKYATNAIAKIKEILTGMKPENFASINGFCELKNAVEPEKYTLVIFDGEAMDLDFFLRNAADGRPFYVNDIFNYHI